MGLHDGRDAGHLEGVGDDRMTAPTTFNDLLREWLRGDEEAVDFALKLWDAAQQWDDLHDEGAAENNDALLAWLAFGKEAHPFFRRSPEMLRGAMLSMMLQWTAANVLERGAVGDVERAWMLRAGIYGVFHVMAWLVGGYAWAEEVGPEIYRSYGESLAEFKAEMADA